MSGLYWYDNTTGNISDGNCQVTVNKVSEIHAGKWTCAGKLLDSDMIDLYDYITVKISHDNNEGIKKNILNVLLLNLCVHIKGKIN